jgi:hypothetical protein
MGVSDPSGDSPGGPATGAARLPGGSDDYLPLANAGDDPRDIWSNILRVEPDEFIRDTRVDWPVIPEGYHWEVSPLYVSLDCIHFYEVPDGTDVSDFLVELAGN